jgi:hypothetical protein
MAYNTSAAGISSFPNSITASIVYLNIFEN